MKKISLTILATLVFIYSWATDHYAVSGTTWGNLDPSTWAATSGGTPTLGDPTSSDNVIFDSNSGSISAFGGTCLSITFVSGYTATFTDNGQTYTIAGSITLISSMTFTVTGTWKVTGTGTVTSNGKTFDTFQVQAPGATVTLGDNLRVTTTFTVTSGTFTANGFDVRTGGFNSSNSNVRTINLGSGTWTISSTGSVWVCTTATNLTINSSTSTIKFTSTSNSSITFAGGSKGYNNIWFSRTGSTGTITIQGTNTFNDVKDDGTGTHTIVFPNVTTSVGSFTVSGTSGHLISLSRTGASGTWTISQDGATFCLDYLSISNSVASGGASWYAGANSTNGGGNTGWTFTACPTTSNHSKHFFKP